MNLSEILPLFMVAASLLQCLNCKMGCLVFFNYFLRNILKVEFGYNSTDCLPQHYIKQYCNYLSDSLISVKNTSDLPLSSSKYARSCWNNALAQSAISLVGRRERRYNKCGSVTLVRNMPYRRGEVGQPFTACNGASGNQPDQLRCCHDRALSLQSPQKLQYLW